MTSKSTPTLHALLARRLDRRHLLARGADLASAAWLGGRASAQSLAAATVALPRVAPSKSDSVIVPDGYRAQVLLRWGDPLFADAAALDPRTVAHGSLLAAGAAAAQSRQFGYNCDGIGVFAATAGNTKYATLRFDEIKHVNRVMVECVAGKALAIAAILGCSAVTVRTHAMRALNTLRQYSNAGTGTGRAR